MVSLIQGKSQTKIEAIIIPSWEVINISFIQITEDFDFQYFHLVDL